MQCKEVRLALANPNTPAPPLPSTRTNSRDSRKFLSLSSRGNLQTGFASEDAGRSAYYALRSVSKRGEKGP